MRFKTIAELVVPKDEAHFVLCTGYDHMPGTRIPYTTNLPLARAIEGDVLLVHTWEGVPLPREHGGPVRMLVFAKNSRRDNCVIAPVLLRRVMCTEDSSGRLFRTTDQISVHPSVVIRT